MTKATAAKRLLWLILTVLVIFTGLCTAFVLVVTAAQFFQERAQAGWPQATASIEKCDILRTSTNGGRRMYIRCRLGYAVGSEQNVAIVYSGRVPAPEVWQYPRNQSGLLEDWMSEHPVGTPITVQYDPADHEKVSLVSTNMPLTGGPKTPDNLKLLGVCAASFLVLLVASRLMRPRSPWQIENSPVALNS